MSGMNESSDQNVIEFLKSNLPKSEIPNIETELRHDFIFGKVKGKGFKKKPTKKKLKTITRKDKKQLGFYNIPRGSVKYKDIVPMHSMWTEYITQVLELEKPIPNRTSKNWESFLQSLYKSDFHGAMMTVVRSKCPSYVGKKGICIMDTRNTFKIVSENNIVTTIPKKQSIFEICVKDLRICIFGKHFCVKPAERSTKKVKSSVHPDL